MRTQIPRKRRDAPQLKSRGIASTILCAVLTAVIAWIEPTATIAQTTSLGEQPPVGMRTTSPLATQSADIPLGSTEIETRGVSPITPSPGARMGGCAGSAAGLSPGAPFDGGGIAETPSLSCTDGRDTPSLLSSPSSIGRVGIPLGATETGDAGISTTAPVAGPNLSGSIKRGDSTSAITNSGNP